MLLTLVRHAKSSWKDAGLLDHDRPLAPRGKRDAPRMARWFAEFERTQSARVDWAWISSAARTRATAEALLELLDVPEHLRLVERALYHATPEGLLDVVRATPRDRQWPVVFGHNPGLTQFANLLLGRVIDDDLPTLAVVTLEVHAAEQEVVAFGGATLVAMQTPKALRRANA